VPGNLIGHGASARYRFGMSTQANPCSPAASPDASRVSEYWAKQSESARASRSVWLNNEVVNAHICKLISGGPAVHWLPWFIDYYLRGTVHFERSLSLCCGDGAHEIALFQTKKVQKVSGFDISAGAIASAIGKFQNAKVPSERYHFEVADANELTVRDDFDLILSSGALHHVQNLEGLLEAVAGALMPRGYFVVVEYVGPNRFQWTDQQLSVINGILRQLDLQYLKNNIRLPLRRPRLEEFMAVDPSEAIRAEEILPLLARYFTVEYLKHFNGTIAHPLYPLLNPELTNAGAKDFDTIIRSILYFEDVLISYNVLTSDFAFAICRRKDFQEDANARPPIRSQFIGFIDIFDDSNLSGWVANASDLTKVVDVDVLIDDKVERTVRCDIFRQDVYNAGYGDGRKGFEVTLAADHKPRAGAVAKLVVRESGELLATRERM
jgi:SAM-dependent methyltransferase